MIAGFTGTKHGMSQCQRDKFGSLMDGLAEYLHGFCHGDCIGADEQAHYVAFHIGLPIYIYPPNKSIYRSNIFTELSNLYREGIFKAKFYDDGRSLFYGGSKMSGDNFKIGFYPEDEYLKRNRAIVKRSDILIATPGQREEILHSGTWSTVRYARKKGIPIWKIYPNGIVETENKQVLNIQLPLGI